MMTSREEIADAMDRVRAEGVAYWSSFSDEEFFARLGDAWSPAENVRHLNKSIRPVVKALTMPRIALRFLFGTTRRPSLDYESLRTKYLGYLDAGGKAGRFSPSDRTETRANIMSQYEKVNRDLRAALDRWNEKQLDRYQLPHPLMGKLTVREMLFFTVYHQLHHIGVVKRRHA